MRAQLKTACLLLFAGIAAAAKTPPTVIPCDLSDSEHCKSTTVSGRPVREMFHEGTSIAVGKPSATVDGEYRVFIRVKQVGPGKTEVRPKDLFATSSDPPHTRFTFHDVAAEVALRIQQTKRAEEAANSGDFPSSGRHPGSGAQNNIGTSKAAKLGRLRKPDPNEVAARQDAATGSRQSATQAGTIVTPEELYLTRTTLRPGESAEGFVYFKKPRHSKVHLNPNDQLSEIDVAVNGVVFRFSAQQ